MKLFMLLLGAMPKGRNIEQHDIFFGIADTLKGLVPDIIKAWPEANDRIHIDAWREVTYIDNFSVSIVPRHNRKTTDGENNIKLFFINLGGYKKDEFEEYHYKMLVAAAGKADAVKQAKSTAFYKHTGFKGAESHIDDRYGVDVDDIFEIADILPADMKAKYAIVLQPGQCDAADETHLGYFRLEKL
jgi:Domain of Unknown Function (DUF1543)